MSTAILKGYEAYLKPFHGMIMRNSVTLAIKAAAPNRSALYAKLGITEAVVVNQLRELQKSYVPVMCRIRAFLQEKHLDAISKWPA
jgi:hypothetical protein